MSVQLCRRYAILGLSRLPKYVYKGHDIDGNKSTTFARNAITYQVRKSYDARLQDKTIKIIFRYASCTISRIAKF